MILFDGGGEFAAIFAAGDGRSVDRNAVRVCEVDERRGREIAEQTRSGRDLELIPADVRGFYVRGDSSLPENIHCMPTQMPRKGIWFAIRSAIAVRRPVRSSAAVAAKWPT